ncbi:MAG: hypothetical protein P4L81_06315 [Candidatus Pacebacteria bacterium]|nr:hypothetical protein [Candidatus Paceibacterota bacterium]
MSVPSRRISLGSRLQVREEREHIIQWRLDGDSHLLLLDFVERKSVDVLEVRKVRDVLRRILLRRDKQLISDVKREGLLLRIDIGRDELTDLIQDRLVVDQLQVTVGGDNTQSVRVEILVDLRGRELEDDI